MVAYMLYLNMHVHVYHTNYKSVKIIHIHEIVTCYRFYVFNTNLCNIFQKLCSLQQHTPRISCYRI